MILSRQQSITFEDLIRKEKDSHFWVEKSLSLYV